MRKQIKAADRTRFRALQELGCIVCGEFNGYYREPDIHHLTEGYRLGHQFTIPLCEWHHRSVPPNSLTGAEAAKQYGPSLAGDKAAFVKAYGTERELLARTDQILIQLKEVKNGKAIIEPN